MQFAHYGLSEGLPQETIHCMDKDALGFAWLGTSDGIVRFDGQNFFIPKEDIKTKLDLSGWRVGALLVNDTIVYAGTGQKGLLAYHILKETTQRIGKDNSNCTAIIKVKDELIAAYYNGDLITINNQGAVNTLNFSTSLNQIVSIAIHDTTVYIANDLGDIAAFELSDLSKDAISFSKQYKLPEAINKLLTIDAHLFALTANGIYKLEDHEFSKLKFTGDYSVPNELSVTDIVPFNNDVYMSTDKGLFQGRIASKNNTISITNWSKASTKYDIYSLNRDAINDIMVHEDNLLIGHNSLDITRLSTKPVFESITSKFNLGNPSTFSIFESKNWLWIGTTSGLIISNNHTGDFKILPELRARAIIEDQDGHVWIGTNTGVKLFKRKAIELSDFKYESVAITYENQEINQNIRKLYKDLNQNIWVVTYNSGIFRFTGDLEANNLSFAMYGKANNDIMLPSIFAIDIVQDIPNSYWITSQKGLTHLTFKDAHFSNPSYTNYDEQDGLITNGVLAANVTANQQLWVTSRKGLNKYNRETDSFIAYSKRNGLTNTFVYNVLEEDNNHLWLSTNGGLFRFDIAQETFTNYSIKDGIQSSEFNLGAALKSSFSNTLYFGGINGLNRFNPTRINELDKEGRLTLTSFSKKGVANNDPSDSPIFFRNNMSINHDDFPLELGFSALDFRPEKNQTFQYRLLPGDDVWNNLNTANSIQLLNLAPKQYTLQIQGKSRNNLWTKPPLEVRLKVHPPWYKSTLAYVLYLLTFLGLVYAFYRIRLQKQLAGQESKRLKDLDDLKSRFITNITHEFRTPLTVILGYLSNLKNQVKAKPNQLKDLNTIEKNSNNLLNLVNQMLDLAKLEQGRLDVNYINTDIVSFTKELVEGFKQGATTKKVTLLFKANAPQFYCDIDPEKLRQIITNLVSNAIKFAPNNSDIHITINGTNDVFQLDVKDQGIGIAKEHLPFIFDRFYQVSDTTTKIAKGTGIGLALTKELVQLLEGTISVDSILNKETVFTVRLPVKQQAQRSNPEFQTTHIVTNSAYVPEDDNDLIELEDTNTVLIVEDNKDIARFIASCLRPDYKVTFAENGSEGLTIAKEKVPDIIVSDYLMPIMDGLELTKQLQLNASTSHIPIIMLTSKAQQEDKLLGLSAGVDAYLTKPFQKEELLLRMQMLIAKRKKLQEAYTIPTVVEKKVQHPKTTDKNVLFLNTVVSAIHAHIEDSNFGATQLANFVAMSDSQLYRKLKAVANTSTAVFIRKVRLEKGKELLKGTDLSVSEIAYSIGFNDPNWFSKAFKEEFKQSPSEFRN